MPDERHLQDAASHLEAGSAERQVKARFATSFSAFRKCLALWAAGRGPDPSFLGVQKASLSQLVPGVGGIGAPAPLIMCENQFDTAQKCLRQKLDKGQT